MNDFALARYVEERRQPPLKDWSRRRGVSSFEDAVGDEWTIAVDPVWLVAVRKSYGVDLSGPDAVIQLARLAGVSPVDFGAVWWSLMRSQAKSRGLDIDGWQERVVRPDVGLKMWAALRAALEACAGLACESVGENFRD